MIGHIGQIGKTAHDFFKQVILAVCVEFELVSQSVAESQKKYKLQIVRKMVTGATGHHGLNVARHVGLLLKRDKEAVPIHLLNLVEHLALEKILKELNVSTTHLV